MRTHLLLSVGLVGLAGLSGCPATLSGGAEQSQPVDAATADGPSRDMVPADGGTVADHPTAGDAALSDAPRPTDLAPGSDSATAQDAPPSADAPAADGAPPPDAAAPQDAPWPDSAPPPDSAPSPDAPWPDSTPPPDSAPSPDAPATADAAPAPDAAPPPSCTWFASPTGVDSNSGTSPSAPLTLLGASKKTQPGDVVCLLAGTYSRTSPFYPQASGTPGAYITYRNYQGEARLEWNGPSSGSDINMVHFYKGKNYIEFRGLTLDAKHVSPANFKCHESHHLRFIDNVMLNGGASGLATKYCDYITAIGNRIHRAGDNQGWSSGISLNSHQWTDTAPGFHSLVLGNIISGCVDGSSNHTDGNGIIMDLSANSYDYTTADTPPVLIANNVVYQNGGRCILLYVVTNIWVVNNTCYKNSLDTRLGSLFELGANKSKDSTFVNNIAVAWNSASNNYWQTSQTQNINYYANSYFGGTNQVPSAVLSDPTKLFSADPQFKDPMLVPSSGTELWKSALPPDQLGQRLELKSTSSLIDKGIDPASLPGIPAAIKSDLTTYLKQDIRGSTRPKGAGFDLGAYEMQ